MDRSVDMFKYDLITLRTSLENNVLLETMSYSCVITNATTGLLLMVILIKQNQEELCAQTSNLKSACNNTKYQPGVPAALLWVEMPFHGVMVVEIKSWPGLVWEVAFQPWACQSIAALLCNLCQLLAQGIWHLQEAQISLSTRAATSSCLPCIDLHRGVTQNLQAGFLSFLGVTRFSLYVCLTFCALQTHLFSSHPPSLFYPSLLKFFLEFLFLIYNQTYGTLHTIFLEKCE